MHCRICLAATPIARVGAIMNQYSIREMLSVSCIGTMLNRVPAQVSASSAPNYLTYRCTIIQHLDYLLFYVHLVGPSEALSRVSLDQIYQHLNLFQLQWVMGACVIDTSIKGKFMCT